MQGFFKRNDLIEKEKNPDITGKALFILISQRNASMVF